MVPGAGLEPAQYCYRGILSPLRLPISPSGHYKYEKNSKQDFSKFWFELIRNGAGNEGRTRGPDLGKVVLYH